MHSLRVRPQRAERNSDEIITTVLIDRRSHGWTRNPLAARAGKSDDLAACEICQWPRVRDGRFLATENKS